MAAELRLPALSLPGLSPDSLGNYVASLGLLRVLSRKWPSTRIAWRDEVLQVIGGPPSLDDLLDEMSWIATERKWRKYDRAWVSAQKKSSLLAQKPKTSATSGVPFAHWQAEAAEELLEVFVAHVVPHGSGRSMNPVLGKAGKIGQRDFAKGWARAADSLMPPKPLKRRKNESKAEKEARDAEMVRTDTIRKRTELGALLQGGPVSCLEKDLNAATWFSHANKLYNNGQRPYRDGLLSPWLMVLAGEGISFLSGGPSRRLGSRSRTVGAFPFVTKAAAPKANEEAGRDTAEFWAPLWERPMTASEVATLFRRGRAELSGRSVQTPAEFASAILRRGVDAGIMEFRRFVLGWTTAPDYVEPRFESTLRVPTPNEPDTRALSTALERVTALIKVPAFANAKPTERKRLREQWTIVIRGAIEEALLNVAAQPNRSEFSRALLDSVTPALDRIDRNHSFRESGIRWEPLPLEWLPSLFTDELPGVEAGLALSLVSGFPSALPFAAFRFGVEWTRERNGKYEYDWTTKPDWFAHPKVAPARWVWGPGELARVLGAVLSRRFLEEAKLDDSLPTPPSGRAPLPAAISQVRQWLDGELDEELLRKWLSRLALFDWTKIPKDVRALVQEDGVTTLSEIDGGLALLGLLQPFADRRPLVLKSLSSGDVLSEETGARTTEVGRSLVTLIRSGNIDAATRLARSRYAMARAPLAVFDVPLSAHAPDRLAAALLFTISNRDRAVLFERWLRPRRRQ